MTDHVEEAVKRIREQVGDEEVILGLSGGVDSSVAAALIHRAIGDQLTCVFVDHGLLRLDEGKMVMEMFAGRLHAKVIHVDASAQFLGHLAGVTDPEQKRKIIGREFVEVFKAEAAKLKAGDGGHKGAQVAGAGHDLSGRRRVGRHQDQEGHHDQEPPQRRRPARAARPEAAGAAARPVQGRGARAGRGAGPAARDGLPPSVPGPGPGRAHPRRGEEGIRRPAAPRRRDLHRGTAQLEGRGHAARTGTSSPARPSRCSCRSRAWA